MSEIVGSLGVSTDISERNEKKLQLSEEELRRIFNNVPVDIIIPSSIGATANEA